MFMQPYSHMGIASIRKSLLYTSRLPLDSILFATNILNITSLFKWIFAHIQFIMKHHDSALYDT